MHLGYHELRNMLQKFKEERDKKKMAPPSVPTTASGPAGARGSERDPRFSRDEYRERDRGYDRHSSRHEYVFSFVPRSHWLNFILAVAETVNVRVLREGDTEAYLSTSLFICIPSLVVFYDPAPA